jgi:hypothetical protein
MEVWRLAPLCLMWCPWRERNAWNFKDVETLVTKLRKIVFNTLYTWISANHSLLISSFAYFLNFSYSFSLDKGSFVYSLCTRLRPFARH